MRFIAELYLPACGADGVEAISRRAEAAARELASDGARAALAGCTHVPEDEMCLLHFEAASRDAVLAVLRHAALTWERVVEAIETVRPV